MTHEERQELTRGIPISESCRRVLVQGFSDSPDLAALMGQARIVTFVIVALNIETWELESPTVSMGIGCYDEDQVALFDAHQSEIEMRLRALGFNFDWVSAAISV